MNFVTKFSFHFFFSFQLSFDFWLRLCVVLLGQAKERIRELEKQLEMLQQQLLEHEDKANKMYLHMYTKGQEAERIETREKVGF